MVKKELKKIGNFAVTEKSKDPIWGRVYHAEGISPTLTTNFKGGVAAPVQTDKRIKQIGNLVKAGNFKNPQRGRVYDPDGISPTLNTCGGGGLEVKILDTQGVGGEDVDKGGHGKRICGGEAGRLNQYQFP